MTRRLGGGANRLPLLTTHYDYDCDRDDDDDDDDDYYYYYTV